MPLPETGGEHLLSAGGTKMEGHGTFLNRNQDLVGASMCKSRLFIQRARHYPKHMSRLPSTKIINKQSMIGIAKSFI